jgi:hypothetical protein
VEATVGRSQDPADEGTHRALIVLVGPKPAGPDLGLPKGLDHVVLDPPAEMPAIIGIERPRSDDGLVGEELIVGMGRGSQRPMPAVPSGHVLLPGRGHLGQHGQAGSDVLAPLGVVGGGGTQRAASGASTPVHRLVELVHGHGRAPRVGAHLGQRGQAARAVEGGVLHALGRHCAGVLLPPLHQLMAVGPDGGSTGAVCRPLTRIAGEQREDQAHGPPAFRVQVGPGPGGGSYQPTPVLTGGPAGLDVGAVDTQSGGQLD